MPTLPSTTVRRRLAACCLAGTMVLGAAACGSDSGDDDAAPSDAPSTVTTERATGTSADRATGTTTAGASEGTASWAKPYETPGQKLTTIEGEGFKVDVYQVGTTKATKTGNFVNPDNNQPIIATGDEIVFVNYVFTNTGSAAIPLSYSLATVDAEYEDWPYMQGMDGITDSALFAQMKVNSDAKAPGKGDAPFMWEPGTSFAYGENFTYQAGSPITFEARLTPADAKGDLQHDKRQTIEAKATIS